MTLRLKFWLITVSALLAVLCTLALGRWQLSRAAQKEAVQASIDAQAVLPELNERFIANVADLTSELHRPVRVRGHWIAKQTVFLDNRQMNNKQGFYVLTPLALEGSSAVVVVQRGWAARDFLDRASVPTIDTPTGWVEIQGRIAPPPSKLYDFGGAESGRIRQNLDLTSFRAELGLPLLPISIQQTGGASEGLLREWPLAATGAEKNYGYAFQWFALSALIAILYVWFQIVRRFFYPRSA